MLELSDDGIRAINAITRASSRLAAGEIFQKGLQATLNLFGRTAFDAVQNAIPGTIRRLLIKGIFSSVYLSIANAGFTYLLGYMYERLGWY